MDNVIYKLADGQLWSVRQARFIDEATAISEENAQVDPAEIKILVSADGKSDVPLLARTLDFYDYPPGELAGYSITSIKRALKELDEEYLTPRTLAGLSVNDEVALSRWNEHEEKAAPLRARLGELK